METLLSKMICAIENTYEAIAPDIGEVNLEQAVEITLDAGRINEYGHCDEEAFANFNRISYSEQCLIVKVALKPYF